MVGIELVKDRGTKTPYLPVDKIGAKIVTECRKNGLIIRPLGDVIVLMPPLSISLQEIKKMVKIVFNSIKLITETG
jgi:adenosylmethionine-8-amino-7-oxononanoate aminotransferase